MAVIPPCTAAVLSPDLGIAKAVGLAFAVAASTFCPLLVLGIWWRGLTDIGAIAGLLTGFVASGIGVTYSLSSWTTSGWVDRSEEHTSELQSLMRISYAVFCLKKKKTED